ncbi:helix-turn-helix domain-containing protein [Chitinophaga pinensis]|uniref:Helix-turn-helix transcriptional regulator n=1 Tax=Chitinophaga pinensis TaxID=79329 RepID=A0A5C6LNA6_9BACT|nr:AraC family transcriptional regulator [Chitinophaga pinensis]TWV96856.1 helix-turn-helix transcriptional regulator [Chitinophaga pinensis]
MVKQQIYSVPSFMLPANVVKEEIHILAHQFTDSWVKSKVTLEQHLFSFLVEGEKSVFYAEKHAVIDNTQFVLLSAGNCIMSEKKISADGFYKSVVLTFEPAVLTRFFLKYPHLCVEKDHKGQTEEPFLVFRTDSFLQNFVQSLCLMAASDKPLPIDLRILKFEELLLYMSDRYPQQLLRLRANVNSNEEEAVIRRSAESNLYNNVTIEELAFLCNMSLSTYKRKFQKIYGTSPTRWFLQKRMEQAVGMLLVQREKPSEIYHKLGYENHSSFTQSFKQVYGLTPSEYQQQKLTV